MKNSNNDLASQYAYTMLEGGEGYNPHALTDARQPTETKEDIISRLRRESLRLGNNMPGTTERRAEISNEIAALEAEIAAAFAAEWTRETTVARRESWNRRVTGGEVTRSNMYAAQEAQGWRKADLDRAVKLHNLPKWTA